MKRMVSSEESFGGVVGPVESSRAQKRPRYESIDGLVLGEITYSTVDQENELEVELELGQPRRRQRQRQTSSGNLGENDSNSMAVVVGQQQIRDQRLRETGLEERAEIRDQRLRETGLEERADPARLRLHQACKLSHEFLQQQRPPQFDPDLTRKHEAEWALLHQRQQDEQYQLRARQEAELAQEFAAQLAQQRRHQRAQLLVSRSAEIASNIIQRQRGGVFAQPQRRRRDFAIANRAILI